MKKVYLLTAELSLLEDESFFLRKLNTVSKAGQDKISTVKAKADKERSLLGELLLMQLCKEHGIETAKQIKDTHGKPYLKKKPGVQFNISHSGKYAVCGWCEETAIGVDIQQERKFSENMAERMLCEEELEKQPENIKERQIWLNRCWTIKESYCKMLGLGLAYGMNHCRIDFERKTVTDRKGRYPRGAFQEYTMENGYYGAVCLQLQEESFFIELRNDTLSES